MLPLFDTTKAAATQVGLVEAISYRYYYLALYQSNDYSHDSPDSGSCVIPLYHGSYASNGRNEYRTIFSPPHLLYYPHIDHVTRGMSDLTEGVYSI